MVFDSLHKGRAWSCPRRRKGTIQPTLRLDSWFADREVKKMSHIFKIIAWLTEKRIVPYLISRIASLIRAWDFNAFLLIKLRVRINWARAFPPTQHMRYGLAFHKENGLKKSWHVLNMHRTEYWPPISASRCQNVRKKLVDYSIPLGQCSGHASLADRSVI